MPKQLRFSFAGADPDPVGLPYTEILERVERHSAWLKALHVSPLKVAAILFRPELNWRRVVKEQDGKLRVCWTPSSYLAGIQMKLARHLQKYVDGDNPHGVPLISRAFAPGNSIIKNAAAHRGNRSSWSIDLANAFESITTRHIKRYLLRRFPFHVATRWRAIGILSSSRFTGDGWQQEYDKLMRLWERDLAWIFTRLWTYRGRLRQGAPSSPLIFNALMARLDRAVVEEVGRLEPSEDAEDELDVKLWSRYVMPVVYTRYGDDLCFSSPKEVFPEEIKAKVKAVVRQQGFEVNPKKVREGRKGVLEFPGVVIVGGRIRPAGSYIARLARRAPKMTRAERRGHLGFLNQFGDAGKLPAIRKLIS